MQPPIVLLHGFAGHAASWEQVTALLPDRRIAAPVLFGHDPGTDVEAPISFEEQVARIVAVLPEEPIRLVGYSLGGRVALGVLAAACDRIASAVIIGANPGLPDEVERAARRASDEAWAALLRERGCEAFFERWEAQALFASQASAPSAAREHQRAIRARHGARSLALAMTSLSLGAMPDYGPALPRMDVPVTLVAGTLDTKFAALAGEMQRRLPRARTHLVAGAGHNVVLEAPEVLARWIDSDP